MYTNFRSEMILKLSEAGIDTKTLETVLSHMDVVASSYHIERTGKELAVRGRDDLERYAKLYCVCKQLEGCTQSTINNCACVIKHFINSVTCPVEEIDANVIRKYLLLYQMDHNISSRTLDRHRGILATWFLWMQNEGYIVKNPCANVAKIKWQAKRKEALTQSELERLRDACRTDRERALVETLYSTGCRISEALNIKVEQVQWSAEHPDAEVIGKGNKHGIVYFSPRAISVLKKYLSSRPHDSEWLFNNERGGDKMTRQNAEKIFRQLRQLAGLEKKRLTPHTMRHTTATIGAKLMPIQVVKEMMRHAKMDPTAIYVDTPAETVKAYHAQAIV